MPAEQFQRNIPAITEEEQARLRKSHVCVAGCGGLGGFSIEYLARIGIGCLTVIDGDRFETSNMNRQILCTADTMGCLKAEAAAERVRKICPETEVRIRGLFLDKSNAETLLDGTDLVIDALDSVPDRLLLAEACRKRKIPLVHGAVQGWNAQIAVIFPESRTMEQLYGNMEMSSEKACLSFTPALCAAIQCAEAVKILTGREPVLKSRILHADLRYMEFDTIPLL